MNNSKREILQFGFSLLLASAGCWAQAPQPDGAGVEPGVLAKTWITGGPRCMEVPDWQVHEYNPDFYIIRESGCTDFEKPIERAAEGSQMAIQVSAVGITDAQFLDAAGVTQSTLFQVLCRFRVSMQLQLVESKRLSQQLKIRIGCQFLLKVRNTLAE